MIRLDAGDPNIAIGEAPAQIVLDVPRGTEAGEPAEKGVQPVEDKAVKAAQDKGKQKGGIGVGTSRRNPFEVAGVAPTEGHPATTGRRR